MKIATFKGFTAYNIINQFADGFTDAMAAAGHDVTVYDLRTGDPGNLDGQYDFAFCVNAIGQQYFDTTLTYSWYIDPYYSHAARILRYKNPQIRAYIDRKHAEFVSTHWKLPGKDIFLPHATVPYDKPIKPLSERTHSIVFGGSYEPSGKYWEMISSTLGPGPAIIAQAKLDDMSIDIGEYTLQYCDSMPPRDLCSGLEVIDRYVRYKRREMMLESITEPVEIYGNGWEHWRGKRDNHQLMGDVSVEALMDIYADSKVVLNNIPGFPTGSHERPLHAMIRGAVVASDTTEWFEQAGLALLKWPYYADGSLTTIAHVHNNRLNVEQHHTWHNRVDEILEAVENYA